MAERMRLMTVLGVSILIFLLGFRTGMVHEQRNKVPQVIVQQAPPPSETTYYIVEGDLPNGKFYITNRYHEVIQFFRLKELRRVLRAKKIKIYDSKGERIF